MKLHTPILNTILTALHKIINENYYSDKVISSLFKSNKRLGKRDRQCIAETTYNIVRFYYYYQYLTQNGTLEDILFTYFQKNKPLSNNTAVFSSQQILSEDIPQRILLSYNDDLWDEAEHQLGLNRWLTEAEALNQPARLVIRTNTLKISKSDLKSKLQALHIETIENSEIPEALILTNKRYLPQTELFKKGFYEFQDLSSQMVGHFIPSDILKTAKRIVDACAGAGGKTLQLAALMQNKGQLIAMDIDEKKLAELRKRATRAGCSNIQIRLIEGTKTIKRLKNTADLLLIDAPCSGTGIIKRNPDIKLKFRKQNLSELIQLQRQILNNYSAMVKPHAYLIYVTCSILPKENEQQVHWFLERHPEFELVKQKTIYPSFGFDGFYMCLMRKNDASAL